jgi:hypothetical protein
MIIRKDLCTYILSLIIFRNYETSELYVSEWIVHRQIISSSRSLINVKVQMLVTLIISTMLQFHIGYEGNLI